MGLDNAIESGLFRALVRIYTSCYALVTERGGTIEDVWNECDQRIVLIHGLTFFVADKTGIPKGEMPKAAEAKPAQEEKIEQPKAENKADESVDDDVEDAKPDIFKMSDDNKDDNKETKQDKAGDTEDDDEDDFNPMAFFSSGG